MQNITHDSDRNGHRLAMTDVNLEDIEYETALPDRQWHINLFTLGNTKHHDEAGALE